MKKYGREKGIVEMREMYKSTYLELKRVRIILKYKDNRIKELRDKHKKK